MNFKNFVNKIFTYIPDNSPEFALLENENPNDHNDTENNFILDTEKIFSSIDVNMEFIKLCTTTSKI